MSEKQKQYLEETIEMLHVRANLTDGYVESQILTAKIETLQIILDTFLK